MDGGNIVTGFATGGTVGPADDRGDDVPALLSRGSHWMPPEAARVIGEKTLTALYGDLERGDCARCAGVGHCACWHGACCSCGSKDHGSCGAHPPFDPALEHHDGGWCLACGHFARQHGCCWVVGAERCGLWCGHRGDHLGYVPGEYLLPPLIGPLDVLRLRFRVLRCPVCGWAPKRRRWEFNASVLSPVAWWRRDDGGDLQMTQGASWQFDPCGCEGREILEGQR